jgi:hypothetical protein
LLLLLLLPLLLLLLPLLLLLLLLKTSHCVLQLVGQLDDVTEEEPEDLAPGPEDHTEDDAAAQDDAAAVAAPAATAAAAAAVSAAAIAAMAVAGCESDSGSSNKSDGSAVPVRSMPVPITQRKVGAVLQGGIQGGTSLSMGRTAAKEALQIVNACMSSRVWPKVPRQPHRPRVTAGGIVKCAVCLIL